MATGRRLAFTLRVKKPAPQSGSPFSAFSPFHGRLHHAERDGYVGHITRSLHSPSEEAGATVGTAIPDVQPFPQAGYITRSVMATAEGDGYLVSPSSGVSVADA